MSYGTFAPDSGGNQFPSLDRVTNDFAMMQQCAVNTVRTYTPPSPDVLDSAALNNLRLVVGLPWTQHVAFLDERRLRRQIRGEIVAQLRRCAGHPAPLLFALGNEIPTSVVRWHGHRAVERFLRELYEEAKSVAPQALLTYVNYPPTEYLELPFFDICSFNVYLHDEHTLGAYLARLQHIAGTKPLLIAEAGADSTREGEAGQARLTAMQVRRAFREGACGAIAFAWTDEWWRGGAAVHDWSFGLVDRDRRPKTALSSVSRVFATAPFDAAERRRWPRASVVVCAYNSSDTIDECLASLRQQDYPDFEIIVVNDGSSDDTGARAARHPDVRVINAPRGGLSRARNIGMHAATGDIVAYCDSDARADREWLPFLVQPLIESDVVASGGPNVVPDDDPWIAQCVARAPGAPTQVLLTDRIAEHVPGCNMAVRRAALLKIGGFTPIYVRAGDDVDVCWRLQAECGAIGFAPAALIWHHHRSSLRAYWRQQVGYGEGEEWLRAHHPDKFAGRRILWRGLLYSPLPFIRSLSDKRINFGVWGSALFPSVYRTNVNPLIYIPHSEYWQLGSLALILLGVSAIALGMLDGAVVTAVGLSALTVTIAKCIAYARASDLRSLPPIGRLPPAASRALYRGTIALLHFIQPLARLHGRVRALCHWPEQAATSPARSGGHSFRATLRLLAGGSLEERFWSEAWISGDAVLAGIVDRLRVSRIGARFDVDDGWWMGRDISIVIAPALSLDLRCLVEDHGSGRCLLRAGIHLRNAWILPLMVVVAAACGASALLQPHTPFVALSLDTMALLLSVTLLALFVRVAESAVTLSWALRGVAGECRLFDIGGAHQRKAAAVVTECVQPQPENVMQEHQ